MPRTMTSGGPFRYPFSVRWTDPVTGRERRKAFVWQGPADEEVKYLKRRGIKDARLVMIPKEAPSGKG